MVDQLVAPNGKWIVVADIFHCFQSGSPGFCTLTWQPTTEKAWENKLVLQIQWNGPVSFRTRLPLHIFQGMHHITLYHRTPHFERLMQNMKTEKQNILLSSVVDHRERQGANPFKTLRTDGLESHYTMWIIEFIATRLDWQSWNSRHISNY
jgi:hypothetical protein